MTIVQQSIKEYRTVLYNLKMLKHTNHTDWIVGYIQFLPGIVFQTE